MRRLLQVIRDDLGDRLVGHDLSKLEEPEKSIFDRVTPRLKELTYGSPAYFAQLEEMKVALDHHYAVNRHHPEWYPDGVRDMTLVDLLEMLVDWVAATKRHTDSNIYRSLDINQKRFGYSDELKRIFENTIEYYSLDEV